jgi:hypothetical protein
MKSFGVGSDSSSGKRNVIQSDFSYNDIKDRLKNTTILNKDYKKKLKNMI